MRTSIQFRDSYWAPLLSVSYTSCIRGNCLISWEAHDLSPQGMWKKVQCLQNVISCQISIGSLVLINTAFVKKGRKANVESDHFQSLVPRKEASIIVLMTEVVQSKDSGRGCRALPVGKSDTSCMCTTCYNSHSTFISVALFTPCINPM